MAATVLYVISQTHPRGRVTLNFPQPLDQISGSDVKLKLERILSIGPQEQRLTFGGRVIQDYELIEPIGLYNGGTLYLTRMSEPVPSVPPPGGAPVAVPGGVSSGPRAPGYNQAAIAPILNPGGAAPPPPPAGLLSAGPPPPPPMVAVRPTTTVVPAQGPPPPSHMGQPSLNMGGPPPPVVTANPIPPPSMSRSFTPPLTMAPQQMTIMTQSSQPAHLSMMPQAPLIHPMAPSQQQQQQQMQMQMPPQMQPQMQGPPPGWVPPGMTGRLSPSPLRAGGNPPPPPMVGGDAFQPASSGYGGINGAPPPPGMIVGGMGGQPQEQFYDDVPLTQENRVDFEAIRAQREGQQRLKREHEAIRQARDLDFAQTRKELEEIRMKCEMDIAKYEREIQERMEAVDRLTRRQQRAADYINRLVHDRDEERRGESDTARALDANIAALDDQMEQAKHAEMHLIRQKLRRHAEQQNMLAQERTEAEAARREHASNSAEADMALKRRVTELSDKENLLERELIEIEERRRQIDRLQHETPGQSLARARAAGRTFPSPTRAGAPLSAVVPGSPMRGGASPADMFARRGA